MLRRNEKVTASPLGLLVNGFHGFPEQLHCDPVGWVLEPRHIQNQHRVRGSMVTADGTEMAITSLVEHCSGEVADEEGVMFGGLTRADHQSSERGGIVIRHGE